MENSRKNPLLSIYLRELPTTLRADQVRDRLVVSEPDVQPHASGDNLNIAVTYSSDSRATLGQHEFCGGRISFIKTWSYGGVLACDGGCNLRIPFSGFPTTYRDIQSRYHRENSPPKPIDPARYPADG